MNNNRWCIPHLCVSWRRKQEHLVVSLEHKQSQSTAYKLKGAETMSNSRSCHARDHSPFASRSVARGEINIFQRKSTACSICKFLCFFHQINLFRVWFYNFTIQDSGGCRKYERQKLGNIKFA